MARDLVEAPPATPPRYSLLIAAPSAVDGRWEAGFEFAPEGCGSSGRTAVDCFGGTEPLDPDDNPEVVGGEPFAVWAADRCSTFGYRARDYLGRARRQLAATESFQVAEEFWEGSLNGEPSLGGQVIDNRPLVDPTSDTLTDGPMSPTGALALLVAGLGRCGMGRQGMIHVTPQVLEHLVAVQAIYRDGASWYSAMGHLVVADDGYTGAGPGADGGVPASSSQWIYATSMVRIRLSPVQTVPAELPEGAPDPAGWPVAVDPRSNEVLVIAQRLAAVTWDECCHLAAEVNLSVPLIGGAS